MFKAYTEFQKLKRIMIGRSYSPSITESESLRQILTPTTKRLLTQLLDETEEDYQNLIGICKDFGAEVLRPDYKDSKFDLEQIPYLMNPRDDLIVLDDHLICTQEALITSVDLLHSVKKYKNKIKRNKKTFGLIPPSIMRLGKDIIFDKQKDMLSNTESSVNYIKNWLEPLGYRIIYTPTHNFNFKGRISHSDGVLSLQKPGVLLTCKDARIYTENIFKGWSACQVNNSWDAMENWFTYRDETKSYLFTDNKYSDEAWNTLISNWLSEWVGYAKETIFDVNVLSLDEKHVIVSNYNKEVFDFLKKHKIEPIISPWRHRYFWDGGIHCITVDLEREGGCEQYL